MYVGRTLEAVHGYGVEPALIDPSLQVAWNRPDWAAAGLHYWPEYGQIPPSSRAAYLMWLADGRSDPTGPVGYVFLFFYGLERRVLVDLGVDTSHAEIAAVAQEVRRLRSIYGSNRSFDSYAGAFLDLLDGAAAVDAPLMAADVGTVEHGWEVPSVIRIGLGRYVAAGQPAGLAAAGHRGSAYVELFADAELRWQWCPRVRPRARRDGVCVQR